LLAYELVHSVQLKRAAQLAQPADGGMVTDLSTIDRHSTTTCRTADWNLTIGMSGNKIVQPWGTQEATRRNTATPTSNEAAVQLWNCQKAVMGVTTASTCDKAVQLSNRQEAVVGVTRAPTSDKAVQLSNRQEAVVGVTRAPPTSDKAVQLSNRQEAVVGVTRAPPTSVKTVQRLVNNCGMNAIFSSDNLPSRVTNTHDMVQPCKFQPMSQTITNIEAKSALVANFKQEICGAIDRICYSTTSVEILENLFTKCKRIVEEFEVSFD
jgi:hypothetical protein